MAGCLSNARVNPPIATRNASCPGHLGAVVNPTVVCAEDSPFEAVPTIVAVYSVAGARLGLSQITVAEELGLVGQLKLPPSLSMVIAYCTVPSNVLLMVKPTERSLLATAVAMGTLQQNRRIKQKNQSTKLIESLRLQQRSAESIRLADMKHRLT